MAINGIQPIATRPLDTNNSVRKLSDEEIIRISTYRPYQKVADVRKNALYTIFLGIPVVDSFIKSSITKGSLYQKTSTFAKNSAHWAGVYAVGLGVLGLKKAINKKSETLDNFDKNHPIVSFGIDIAALFTALNFAKVGVKKIQKEFKDKAPNFVKIINNKIKQPLSKKLNQTKFNKKHLKAFDKLVNKNPYTQAAGLFLAVTTAPIMALATIIRHNKEINSAIKEANTNYIFLKSINDLLPEKEKSSHNAESADNENTEK